MNRENAWLYGRVAKQPNNDLRDRSIGQLYGRDMCNEKKGRGRCIRALLPYISPRFLKQQHQLYAPSLINIPLAMLH